MNYANPAHPEALPFSSTKYKHQAPCSSLPPSFGLSSPFLLYSSVRLNLVIKKMGRSHSGSLWGKWCKPQYKLRAMTVLIAWVGINLMQPGDMS